MGNYVFYSFFLGQAAVAVCQLEVVRSLSWTLWLWQLLTDGWRIISSGKGQCVHVVVH